MDWNDIEVAADPGNQAYTPDQLLGHALILLEREAPKTPFVSPQEAHGYSYPVSRIVRVLNAIWVKHLRSKQSNTPAVVRSLERALEQVDRWFKMGFPGGAEEVMAEKRFDESATRICHAEGYWLPGTYTGRFWREPTPEELAADWAALRADSQRLAVFEACDRLEWLSRAGMARHKRAPWELAAEGLIGLRLGVEEALPSGDPSLIDNGTGGA